jgi:hypothetical protein
MAGEIAGPAFAPTGGWLRHRLEQLCAIERPSASEGERRAADWVVDQLSRQGAEARIEVERAHGSFYWPLCLGAGAGALAGLATLRGRRLLGGAIGAAAAAGIASDYPPGPRWIRRLLPKHDTTNVIAELGPPDAARTIVLVAHHDAPRSGLLFHPGIPAYLSRRFPVLWERNDTSPPMMFPVVGGPAAVAAGSLLGSRALTKLGSVVSAASVGVIGNIGASRPVPGANDNGSGVIALVALARALVERPTASVRVILLSAGSEESFSEGIKAFGERHFAELPQGDTFFLILESIASPHLCVLRGEGFLKMWEYPAPALQLIDGLAEEMGIWLVPNLRLRNGTDGIEPLAAGYPTVALCSCTSYKTPRPYHWPDDVPENLNYDTLADAIRLAEAVIRRLDQSWL